MAFQTVFKRYELKYMLTFEEKEKILEAICRIRPHFQNTERRTRRLS